VGAGIAAAAGLLAWGTAAAPADSGRLADLDLRLTSASPASPTGMTVHAFIHREGDRDAKPSPLRSVVLRLPAGVRFDNGALPLCEASDDEIRALGPQACPDESELTVGSLSAVTGLGPPADPIVGEDHVFNGPGQLIEIVSAQGGSASPAFDRVRIDGSTLTARPPKTPGGPPNGESAIRSIDFAIPVRAAGGRSLITTPPACPAGGSWRTLATFAFADGSADTVGSSTRCTAPPGPGPGPQPEPVRGRMHLTVRPRHVRAGRRVRVALRVRSHSVSCLAGVTVRLGGRTARTGAHGRAALTLTFRRPGALRRARATKPGCDTARAPLRVMRAIRR
jgi:hypothetical protein